MQGSRPGEARRRIRIKQQMARRVDTVVLVLLAVISLAHLLRLLTGAELIIDGTSVPLWVSILGCGGPALLAGLFWWSHH